VFGAFVDGWRRVVRAPVVTASLILAVLLLAVPLGRDVSEPVFPGPAELGARLEPEIVLGLWDGAAAPADPTLPGPAFAYILFWLFVSGGILDRFARNRPEGTAQFFAACGVFFVRFLRLGLLVGVLYFALFRWLRPYLWNDVVFVAILGIVILISDFAKVRAVVEDRRSMLGALAAGLRFIRRRPLRTAGLYVLNVLTVVLVLFAWDHHVAPAANADWLVFLLAQVFLALRIAARLALMASEVAFFQGELAHAEYTAAPEIDWPDSPAVEAIQNLSRSLKNGARSNSK
jgi:hypothetical protein